MEKLERASDPPSPFCIQSFEPGTFGRAREGRMWNRRDWDEFFQIVRKPWQGSRPPRPVDRSSRDRLVPAEGYSLAELDDAGISLDQAEQFGLPVDAGRVGSYGPNVWALRDYLRATRARI